MQRWIDRAADWLFTTRDPRDLAGCRILFFSLMFLIYGQFDFGGWANTPAIAWRPVILLSWLPHQVLEYHLLESLSWLWRVSLLLSAIGLWTRFATVTSFITGFLLLGTMNSIGGTYHTENMVIFTLSAFAFSRCGDVWSIDAWRTKKRAPSMPGEYGWPIHLVQGLMGLIFWSAGFAKLAASKGMWAVTPHLSTLLRIRVAKGDRAEPWSPEFSLWIADHPTLCILLAMVTVLLEFLAPLTLFYPSARPILIPGLFLMMLGFWALMGIPFPGMLSCFVFWIPWSKLGAHGPRKAPLAIDSNQ